MKRIMAVGIMFVGIIVLSGCDINGVIEPKDSLKKSQVVKIKDNYTKKNSSSVFGNNLFKRQVDVLNGRETLLKVKVDELSTLTISYDFSHVKNKTTMLVTDNKRFGYTKTSASIDNKQENNSKEFELKQVIYFIKLVGEKSSFDMTMNLDFPQNKMSVSREDQLGEALDFEW